MHFFTATINSWKHLLADDEIKKITIDAVKWLSEQGRVHTHGFVIMPNHVHILWTILTENPQHPETTFTSYTAHQFKKYLQTNHRQQILQQYTSTQNDRAFHFWERRSLSKKIISREMAFHKLDYIHLNPVREKWLLAEKPEDYHFSSASFYAGNDNMYAFLTHLHGYI